MKHTVRGSVCFTNLTIYQNGNGGNIPKYVPVRFTDNLSRGLSRYAIEVEDDDFRASKTLALARALPDLDIFQATLICDALNREDSTASEKIVAIIDRYEDRVPRLTRKGERL